MNLAIYRMFRIRLYIGRAVRLTSRDDVGVPQLKFDVILAHVMINTVSVSGVLMTFRKV